MKKLFQSIMVALFILAMSMPTYADTTGSELAEYCKNTIDGEARFSDGVCMGLIKGFADGYSGSGAKSYCIPNKATNSQIQKVVVKYLDNHPARLHEWYGKLVLDAIKEAFPCKETNSGK